jgi:hypothetical protein
VHVWRMNPRMDLADASLIVAAEASGTRKVFTIVLDKPPPSRVERHAPEFADALSQALNARFV